MTGMSLCKCVRDRFMFFQNWYLDMHTASNGHASWLPVDGSFVNGLFRQQRNVFGDRDVSILWNWYYELLACAAVWLGTFGGTFSPHLHGRVVGSNRTGTLCDRHPTNEPEEYAIALRQEEVWRRGVKLQVPEKDSEQEDFVMTELFTSALRLVRETE